MSRSLTLALFFFYLNFSYSQNHVFVGQQLRNGSIAELDSQFTSYQVFQLNVPAIDSFVQTPDSVHQFTLDIGIYQWDIVIRCHEVRGHKYKLTEFSGTGKRDLPKGKNITFIGQLLNDDNSKVSLTICNNVLYGFIKSERFTFFIEPVKYFKKESPADQYVLYAMEAVKSATRSCGATDAHKRITSTGKDIQGAERSGGGKNLVLQLAIASDKSMFNKYGSVEAVETHNLGVINNIAANYDNEFGDSVTFVVTQIYVISGAANDPWSISTDAPTLLQSFTNWGPSGFSEPHDLGQLWTARDFNGTTVGIAWIGTLCSTYGYHCLQDWSTNAHDLRVMTAHEIGHNLGADHDPSGSNTIMSPTVVNTTTWSATSNQTISSTIASYTYPAGCLSLYASNPPKPNFSASPTSGCASLQATFNYQGTTPVEGWLWSFTGGTPYSSTSANPVVTYPSPGIYSVKLKVSNSAGEDSITKTNYIEVKAVPTPNFTFTVSGRTVTFTNTSINATSYSWNFGNGNTSTSVDPVFTYASDGTYNVTLTATSSCGSLNLTKTVTIVAPPTANFTATPVLGCTGLKVTFTNTSSTNSTGWVWTLPGGTPSTSTDKNPIVTYSTAGVYLVKLKATNSGGADSITKIDFIKVGPPVANFTSSTGSRTVTFTNTSTNATSYSWAFSDRTTSKEVNPVKTYTADGTYSVTLTATNSCTSSKLIKSISVVSPPTANFTATTVAGCAPLSITFTNSSSTNTTGWVWTFPGGTPSTSTAKSPVVSYPSAGSFAVSLKATNSVGADSITKADFVKVGPPTADFNYSVNGRTVTFTNTSTRAVSYSWAYGNGTTSTMASPVYTYASDGTYNVTLTATNPCTSTKISKTVVIATPPTPNFTAKPVSGCAGLKVTFTNTSSSNATGWVWTFPGGTPSTSTDKSPIVIYGNAGIFSVKLKATNTVGADSITKADFIKVGPPTPNFTYSTSGRTVTFTNTSINATSYSWKYGNGKSSTTVSPVYTYSAAGTYNVTLTATNGCTSASITKPVVVTSSLAEPKSTSATTVENESSGVISSSSVKPTNSTNSADISKGLIQQISAYPNPNSGAFTVELKGTPGSNIELTILNLLGKTIVKETEDFRDGFLQRQFDLTAIPPGWYMIKAKTGQHSVTQKLVIERNGQ